jgi:hypothetical protein
MTLNVIGVSPFPLDRVRPFVLGALFLTACGLPDMPHQYQAGCLEIHSEIELNQEALDDNFTLLVRLSQDWKLPDMCTRSVPILIYATDELREGRAGFYEWPEDRINLANHARALAHELVHANRTDLEGHAHWTHSLFEFSDSYYREAKTVR